MERSELRPVRFYRTRQGNEPVREFFRKELTLEEKKIVATTYKPSNGAGRSASHWWTVWAMGYTKSDRACRRASAARYSLL